MGSFKKPRVVGVVRVIAIQICFKGGDGVFLKTNGSMVVGLVKVVRFRFNGVGGVSLKTDGSWGRKGTPCTSY